MEGAEEVGLVLARASDLRSKIDRCILENAAERRRHHGDGLGLALRAEDREGVEEGREEEEAEQDEDSLLEVRDALESLEHQLSSLQALEQQQVFEKEAALAQIDRCRVFLLSKIRKCKGDSEVVQELSKFAGGNTEEDGDDDLLLPPYSGFVPEAFILEGLSSSLPLPKSRKFLLAAADEKNQEEESCAGSVDSLARSLVRGAGLLARLAVKSTAVLVGVIAVLGLAGFEPRLMRRGRQLELPELVPARCPPGMAMVVEDRVARCVVKERVEVPFGSVDQAPVVSLGLG